MPNNPVQIVLNAQNYVHKIEVPPGGSNKDFYAGRDKEFVAHRRSVAAQVTELEKAIIEAKVGLQYACVEFKEEGWAKSHRPNKQLFPPQLIRSMGGNELGTLVVELTADDVRDLPKKIASAEEQTRWFFNEETQKNEARPSRLRSEVGAIGKIRLYGPQDRRKFTLEQALGWLMDPRTGGAYYIETFVPPLDGTEHFPSPERRELAVKLLANFEQGLRKVSDAIEVSKVQTHWTPGLLYVIKVGEDVQDKARLEVHRNLLAFLDQHPAVRAILLPPVLQSSAHGPAGDAAVDIPAPDASAKYPVVGIIDTGVALLPAFDKWRAGGVEFINDPSQDRFHGTFIAGLVTCGSTFNAGAPFDERPCKFFDLGLHPTSSYGDYYPRGFLDFLEQLDAEIQAAKAADVRIFNMSLSVTLPVEDANYSLFAHALDRIADKHNVLFVLPAGNLEQKHWRSPWPEDADQCLQMLAEYPFQDRDRIYQPADSVRSLVVGSLEPPAGADLRPSRFTRRGPGPSLGAKPDLSHVGGRGHPNHGLASIAADGTLTHDSGTSYAAPFVAKTLAVVDRAIAGEASIETLCALAIHGAELPATLLQKKLGTIAKRYAGAGTPRRAESILEVEDSSITLVFSGTLGRGAGLSFDFSWPTSLYSDEGACRGTVQLTTVYRPPINRDFGAEFVLVNIDTWLRQAVVDPESGEISYKNRLTNNTEHGIEKERVTHGAKWWPVKRFAQRFPRGIGRSSAWKLVLEPLCRAEFSLADNEVVPFCTVLTIGDPNGNGGIFNEVRTQLQASGVQVEDIRVALSPQLRARPGS